MKRLHLLEIEDQSWCPVAVRDGITDFLQFAVDKADLYRAIVPRLEQALETDASTRVVDLCSGGGGPWRRLVHQLEPVRQGRVSVSLTDLYINVSALSQMEKDSAGKIDFYVEPVSAMGVPVELHGFRTLFSSFHHFKPAQAKSILQDALDKGQGIAIFESTQRHPLLLLYMLLTPVLVAISLPFMRPFKWSRLLWTYLVPLVPLGVMFDGVVSCLRTYSPKELEGLVVELSGSDRYQWTAGVEKLGSLPVGVTYLIGYKS